MITLKKSTTLLVLLLSANISYLAQTRTAHKPQKKPVTVPKEFTATSLKEIVQNTEDTKPKTYGLTVEKYVNNIDVNPDGTSTQTWDILERAKTTSAVKLLNKFERPFNRDLEEMAASDVYILKADGTRKTLPDSAIQIRRTAQAEAAPSFSSMMELEIGFDGLEVGDGVHYRFTLKTLKPFFGNHFDRMDYLFSGFDWDSAEINLTAPADFPLYIQAVRLDGGRLANEGGKARWRWKKSNFKAMEIEDQMLDFMSSSPRVAITNYKNYEELGAAYWAEAEKKTAVTPDIQKLADEITKDAKSPEQQAYEIYEWVNKNIRYLSIVLDRGGWVPHDSTQILANRYGDCKDYTTVLNSLLQAKSIESYPVIIRADMSDWFPDVAVSSYFNHAILYIPSLSLFADATAPNTRLGLIPQTIVGKKAFLAGKKTGIIETPSNKPDDNQLLSDVEIDLSQNGDLKAVSKNTYQGRNEMLFRPLFENIGKNSETFVSLILSYYGINGRGRIVKVGNPFKVGEPFSVEMEVNLNGYVTFAPNGTLKIPVGLNLYDVNALEQLVKPEKRKTPLIFGAMRLVEKYSVVFPDGVSVDTLPPASGFSNSVGSFRDETVMDGKKVNIVRELVIKKDEISADEYPQARELITRAIEAFASDIQYRAAPALVKTKTGEIAKQSIAKPKSPYELMRSSFDAPKKLSPLRVAQLELKLTRSPDDLETRKSLVRFYSSYQIRDTPTRVNARIRHLSWFIEKYPEMDQIETLGTYLSYLTVKEPEFGILKNAWIKKVESDKTNSRIRLNAVDFISKNAPGTAEELLIGGMKIDSDNYEFPLRLSKLFHFKADTYKDELPVARIARLKKEVEYGVKAVDLLKKERSTDRDRERKELLQNLSQSAFELEQYDTAAALATELILDFGNSALDVSYDSAAHIGNIILGRIALRKNDRPKAAEYLLIAIRAPLRKEKSWLPNIDTTLAKELLATGDKDTVIEYLHLCENLWNLKNEKQLFDYQAKALRLWQEQIKQDKTPSFDFQKP